MTALRNQETHMLSIVVHSPTPGKPETWPNLVFVGLLKSLAGGLGCTSS